MLRVAKWCLSLESMLKIVTFIVLALLLIENGSCNPADLLTKKHSYAKEKEWCDPVLGCLALNKSWYSKARPINVLPDTREKINTRFYLHTREVPNYGVEYIVNADDLTSIQNSPYDPTKQTIFICHGFLDTGRTAWLMGLAMELLNYEDCNVMRIDWGDGSKPMYYQATANTRVVGLEIGHMVDALKNAYGLDPALVYCIGHSLGAHVCGYGGEQVPGMGRISGLDPAGPYFTGTPTFVRLDDTDAVFVDNIHTDTDPIFLLGYGTQQPMGNVDIYPNSGHDQPGCNPALIGIEFITADMANASRDVFACSHIRAIKYFTEAVNSPACKWVAHECLDYDTFENGECYTCNDDNTRCTYLGPLGDVYNAKTRVNAMFYLDTNKKPTFCLQHYEVSILTANSSEAESWVMGRLFIYLYGDNGENIEHLQITKNHERIDSGAITRTLFTSPIDVQHINRIVLKWVYDDKIDNPGSYCWGLVCNRNLYVQSIKVSPISHYPETERLSYDVTGCALDGSYTEVKDGEEASFIPSETCTPVN